MAARERGVTRSVALVAAGGMVVGVLLTALPARWTAPLKSAAATVVLPGQRTLRSAGDALDRGAEVLARYRNAAACQGALEAELARLEAENRRLRQLAEVSALSMRPHEEELLFAAQAVPARVVGQQGRAFLARRHLIDAGAAAGTAEGDLVLEAPLPLIDRGADAAVKPGHLVLRGQAVWGKVAEVGRYSSAVQRVVEPGYRDLVRLVPPRRDGRAGPPGASPVGPRGVLEGAGERTVRVRYVAVTEPVEEGDLVLAASTEGVLAEPLLYGRVTRAERSAGAAHWDIRVEPAAAMDPAEVAVLRLALNPARAPPEEP